jgi:hypothetical protein
MVSDKTKNKLFWILQVSGWITFYLIYLVLYYRDYISDLPRMGALFTSHLSGFVVTILMRYVYRKVNYDIRSIPQILIIIIVTSFVFANVWFWADVGLTYISGSYFTHFSNFSIPNYVNYIWSNSFVFVAWSALYFGIKFWFDFQNEKRRTEQANMLAQKAQLQMLRYQLNPHFLFNSMNSIRALVEEDKKRAKEMITELSEFLRYSLISKNYSNVPFNEELDAMKHYLAIEKTRYEENLIVNYDIDPSAESYPVLSFLIHPLIENALKYGMKTSKLPLRINLKAKVVKDTFSVTVCNSGHWIDRENSGAKNSESTGTGLDNVKKRLTNAFPGKHDLIIEKGEDQVCITIKINN